MEINPRIKARCVERRSNATRNGDGGLVLPCSDNVPASAAKGHVHASVAGRVALELWTPVVLITTGGVPMLGATVPEAAVDEDSDAPPREHDIGPYGDIGDADEVVDTKPETGGVECSTDLSLWSCVPASIPRHPRGHQRVGRSRIRKPRHYAAGRSSS